MLCCIQSVLHKLNSFRCHLLAPVLMGVSNRCLVWLFQMIHRGGRYQTAQLTYVIDNSVSMPEHNLRYLGEFPCNTYFFTPLRCLSDYVKESCDSLLLAIEQRQVNLN